MLAGESTSIVSSNPGREVDLLRALNAAAASLQQSARSEAEVFRAFRKQITGLGMHGGLSFLDEQGEWLTFCAIAQPEHKLSGLEKLAGVKAEGYQVLVAKVNVYQRVVEAGESVFLPESHEVVAQLLPDWLSRASDSVLKALGSDPTIYAPLKSEGRIFGLLNVAGKGLTHEDVPAFEAFANHVSVALENARFFAALKSGEARNRKLMDNLPIGVYRTTPGVRGKVLMANPSFLAMFGYESMAELDGVAVADLYDDIEERRSFTDELLARGSVVGVENKFKKQDGLQIWGSVTANVVHNLDTGDAEFFDCVIEDITERVRVEEELFRQADELATLHALSLDITAALDLPTLLQTIVKRATRLLKARGGSLSLCDPERQEIRVYAEYYPGLSDQTGQVFKYGEGAIGIVAQTGKPLLIDDYQNWPQRVSLDDLDQPYTGVLSVPMRWRGQVSGVLQVMDEVDAKYFNKSNMELLILFANQAAIAIENARLFEQSTTERRHLSLLYDVGRDLAAILDIDEILNRATTLTCQALGGLLGEAFLYHPDKDLLSLRAMFGRTEAEFSVGEKKLKFKRGSGLAGWVAQNQRSIYIPEVAEDNRWQQVPGVDEDVHSALCAPILQGDRLLGVLAVLHHQPAAFTPDHQELLQAICHQVGLALSNAERYQQVQSLVDLLEVEQRRLDNLVERLPVGVLLLDKDHTLLVANSLGSEILGLLGTGAVGDPLSTLGPYDLKDLIAQHASPMPVNITYDGPPQRVFEAQVRPLGIEQSQWVITVREVTEEREIQVRIQMQNRLATVGQLASGIAHDFNNIMAAIMVYADLLQRDLALSPTGRERLAIIQNQVERATSLIRQILDFSRRSVMEQINMDLLPFTKELDKLLERVLPETIHLELSYENEEFWVKADPTRLQQVFMNLAVNARDAMSEGGSLFFLLDRIQLLSSEHPPFPSMLPGEWVRVRVRDTGEGIPPDVIPHIFEPFFTTKPVGEGTGLGLAQAYGIVKQHDGFIDVQSQVGEGTIFTIYLPALAVAEQEVVLDEQPAGIEGEGETILVVEDDQVTLGALRDLLSSQNYNVLMAENGIKALEIFEQRSDSIDLVVCDVVMPEMGGVELFIALSARYPHVKMLFITGHPLQKENHALLERGSVHWMQKPFSVPDFNQALQELLEEDSSNPTS